MKIAATFSSYPKCLSSRLFSTAATPRRTGLDFGQIRQELLSRPLNILEDYLAPTNSELLRLSLSDFLPPSCQASPYVGEGKDQRYYLPQGHHLVYFPARATSNQLLPDGTDDLHSPGAPFVRRMWAGGSLHFNTHHEEIPHSRVYKINRAVCAEGVRDVGIRGPLDQEKIFVDIERHYALRNQYDRMVTTDDPRVEKTQFLERTPDRMSPFFLFEKRTLVFMRAEAGDRSGDQSKSNRFVKPPLEEDFRMQIVPTPSLLFRFSALSFNAHRIHLSSQYASEIEGHRDMLVHGPLTLVLILSLLRSQLKAGEMVSSFHYRNLAPLYVNETMTVCGKRKLDGGFVMWIEDSRGSLAVKGDAILATIENDKKEIFKDQVIFRHNKVIQAKDLLIAKLRDTIKSKTAIIIKKRQEYTSKTEKLQEDIASLKQVKAGQKPKNSVAKIFTHETENQPELQHRIVKHVAKQSLRDIATERHEMRAEVLRKQHNIREVLWKIAQGRRYLSPQRRIGIRMRKLKETSKRGDESQKERFQVRKSKSLRVRLIRNRHPSPLSIHKVGSIPKIESIHEIESRDWKDGFRKMLIQANREHSITARNTRIPCRILHANPPIEARHVTPKLPINHLRSTTESAVPIRRTTAPYFWKTEFHRMLREARKVRQNPLRARERKRRKSEEEVEKEVQEDLKFIDDLFGSIELPKKPEESVREGVSGN